MSQKPQYCMSYALPETVLYKLLNTFFTQLFPSTTRVSSGNNSKTHWTHVFHWLQRIVAKIMSKKGKSYTVTDQEKQNMFDK